MIKLDYWMVVVLMLNNKLDYWLVVVLMLNDKTRLLADGCVDVE
jgi:hypothetical protein